MTNFFVVIVFFSAHNNKKPTSVGILISGLLKFPVAHSTAPGPHPFSLLYPFGHMGTVSFGACLISQKSLQQWLSKQEEGSFNGSLQKKNITPEE